MVNSEESEIAPNDDVFNAEAIIDEDAFVDEDVDENDELTSKFGIRNVPTVIFLKGEEVVDKHVGAAPKSTFVEKVEALLK